MFVFIFILCVVMFCVLCVLFCLCVFVVSLGLCFVVCYFPLFSFVWFGLRCFVSSFAQRPFQRPEYYGKPL